MKTLTQLQTAGIDLNDAQRADLFLMLSKRMHARTRAALWSRISLPLSLWIGHRRFDRIHIEGDSVSYCAGQDYPAEIRELRAIILGR